MNNHASLDSSRGWNDFSKTGYSEHTNRKHRKNLDLLWKSFIRISLSASSTTLDAKDREFLYFLFFIAACVLILFFRVFRLIYLWNEQKESENEENSLRRRQMIKFQQQQLTREMLLHRNRNRLNSTRPVALRPTTLATTSRNFILSDVHQSQLECVHRSSRNPEEFVILAIVDQHARHEGDLRSTSRPFSIENIFNRNHIAEDLPPSYAECVLMSLQSNMK